MGGRFGKFVLLFLVGGFGCLVHDFRFKIDGVKSEVGEAISDVIRVLFEQILLFLDPPGLRVVKVLFVLGLVLFVSLEPHKDFFALKDFFNEERQIFGRLGLFYIIDFIFLIRILSLIFYMLRFYKIVSLVFKIALKELEFNFAVALIGDFLDFCTIIWVIASFDIQEANHSILGKVLRFGFWDLWLAIHV